MTRGAPSPNGHVPDERLLVRSAELTNLCYHANIAAVCDSNHACGRRAYARATGLALWAVKLRADLSVCSAAHKKAGAISLRLLDSTTKPRRRVGPRDSSCDAATPATPRRPEPNSRMRAGLRSGAAAADLPERNCAIAKVVSRFVRDVDASNMLPGSSCTAYSNAPAEPFGISVSVKRRPSLL